MAVCAVYTISVRACVRACVHMCVLYSHCRHTFEWEDLQDRRDQGTVAHSTIAYSAALMHFVAEQ